MGKISIKIGFQLYLQNFCRNSKGSLILESFSIWLLNHFPKRYPPNKKKRFRQWFLQIGANVKKILRLNHLYFIPPYLKNVNEQERGINCFVKMSLQKFKNYHKELNPFVFCFKHSADKGK